jgi:hypothetical protein
MRLRCLQTLADRGASASVRLAPVAAVLALAAMLAWSLGSMTPEPRPLGRPRSCVAAQMVAGQLRCDEERFTSLDQVCPGAPAQPLEPGDALEGCAVGRMSPADLAALVQPVDLDRASIEELASLPGIGPVLAARIVAARPIASVDALLEIRGIGPVKLAGVRPRARVGARAGEGP